MHVSLSSGADKREHLHIPPATPRQSLRNEAPIRKSARQSTYPPNSTLAPRIANMFRSSLQGAHAFPTSPGQIPFCVVLMHRLSFQEGPSKKHSSTHLAIPRSTVFPVPYSASPHTSTAEGRLSRRRFWTSAGSRFAWPFAEEVPRS